MANQQTYFAKDNGIYFVKIKDSNSCPSISDTVAFIYDNVEENLTGGQEFKIFPNPGTGIFYIDLKLPEPLKVNLIITTTLGTEVYNSEYLYNKDQAYQLDLSSLSAGIYFVRLQYDGKELITKIVKE